MPDREFSIGSDPILMRKSEGHIMNKSMIVYDSWDFFAQCVGQAQRVGEWDQLSEILHSGFMAIQVDGLPRVIDGTVH